MENKLEIFKNEEFGEVRTTILNDKPYVCLTDVCKILEIKNARDCKSRLNQKGVVTTDTLTAGGNQKMTFIDESNLYKIIFQSRKPEAEKFTDWVTNEVLPAIRTTGGYIYGEETMNEDQLVLTAMSVLNRKVENLKLENLQQKQIIGELQPKADYTDLILQSKYTVPVSSISKDYGMSPRTMNEKLHELGVQYKVGSQWLLYAKYQDCGYTHSKTIPIKHKTTGLTEPKMYTEWTQKGRLFLYNLLKEHNLLPMIEREGR